MAGKKLKTTIKARIMRLGIISVAACSVIMGAFAIVVGTTDLTHSPLTIILVTLLMAAVITALEIAIATLVAKQITNSIKLCSDRLEALAEGDFHSSVPSSKRGDETQMLEEALSEAISSISSVTDDASRILKNVSDGNLDVKTEADYQGDFVEFKNAIDNTANPIQQEILNSKIANLVTTLNAAQSNIATIESTGLNAITVAVKADAKPEDIANYLGVDLFNNVVSQLGVTHVNGFTPLSPEGLAYIKAQAPEADSLDDVKGKTVSLPLTVNNGVPMNVDFTITFK